MLRRNLWGREFIEQELYIRLLRGGEKKSTEVGKAIAKGELLDSERLKMMDSLAIDLK